MIGLTPSTLFSPSYSLPKLYGCIANIFRRRNKFMTARTTLLSVLLLGASWVVAQNTAPGSTSPSGSSSSQGTTSNRTGTAGSMGTGNNTSSGGGTNSFQVSDVTKVADHCSTSGRGPSASLG